jgi:hypothetical protein
MTRSTKSQAPAFAEAPARRTRLRQAGLRAGRPNSKQAPINKIPNSKQNRFGHFRFGAWKLFVIWVLGFGIFWI